MKDLIISYNEEKGFYCEEFSSHLFHVVLKSLIDKYNLKFDINGMYGEIEMYFGVKELNPDFNIELVEEDGSHWIFG